MYEQGRFAKTDSEDGKSAVSSLYRGLGYLIHYIVMVVPSNFVKLNPVKGSK